MSIPVQCSCGRTLQAPKRLAGGQARCPACQEVVAVPWPEDAADHAAVTSRPGRIRHVAGRSIDDGDEPPTPRRSRATIIGLVGILIAMGVALLGGGGLAAYY